LGEELLSYTRLTQATFVDCLTKSEKIGETVLRISTLENNIQIGQIRNKLQIAMDSILSEIHDIESPSNSTAMTPNHNTTIGGKHKSNTNSSEESSESASTNNRKLSLLDHIIVFTTFSTA
jgi:hypothetical protein